MEIIMENTDTVNLLQECDSGTKMAASSISEVLDRVENENLARILTESREHHEKLGNELHALLNSFGKPDKEPTPMAKGMSWIKTNMKLSMEDGDATVADLMTDGCNMGIKSLNKYQNRYAAANEKAKEICARLIRIEEELLADLRKYL